MMNRIAVLVFCVLPIAVPSVGQIRSDGRVDNRLTRAPRIWTEEALRDWANPVAGINLRPKHLSEADFYSAPVVDLRTYPFYHPDYEPAGYLESLKKRAGEPLLTIGKARSREGWIEAGRRVFEELDAPQTRTADFRMIEYVRSREALKKFPTSIMKNGQLAGFRWVVEKNGELKLSVHECFPCHSRMLQDGTMITGAQGHSAFSSALGVMLNGFNVPKEAGAPPDSPAEGAYASWGVPWITGDIHERSKTMSPEELQKLFESERPSTFARLLRFLVVAY